VRNGSLSGVPVHRSCGRMAGWRMLPAEDCRRTGKKRISPDTPSGDFFYAAKSPEKGRKQPFAEKISSPGVCFPGGKLPESREITIFVR